MSDAAELWSLRATSGDYGGGILSSGVELVSYVVRKLFISPSWG